MSGKINVVLLYAGNMFAILGQVTVIFFRFKTYLNKTIVHLLMRSVLRQIYTLYSFHFLMMDSIVQEKANWKLSSINTLTCFLKISFCRFALSVLLSSWCIFLPGY